MPVGGPDWLQRRQHEAAERVSALSVPTSEEEVWRYSRINDLDLDQFKTAEASTGTLHQDAMTALLKMVGPCAAVVVLKDEALVHAEVSDKNIALTSLRQDGASELSPDEQTIAVDYFVEANASRSLNPLVVRVRAGAVIDRPTALIHWIESDDLAVYPRASVFVGDNAICSVLELYIGPGRALVAPVMDIRVGQAANVSHLIVQELSDKAWQIAYQVSSVAQDASLRSGAIALGGYYARLRSDAELVGQGASSTLLCAFLGSGDQMHDFRTLQSHVAPKTTSDLLFKGAVDGASQSVYSGLIRIRKGAHGTNAVQTNRNLVLSEHAHADSVPNLEIDENDVRCAHASAVGPIDREQRYYLESRGIPTEVADELLIRGFFQDVLGRMGFDAVRAIVEQRLYARLGARSR